MAREAERISVQVARNQYSSEPLSSGVVQAVKAQRNALQDSALEARREHEHARVAMLDQRAAVREARLFVAAEEDAQAEARAAERRAAECEQAAEHERAERRREREERDAEDAASERRRAELRAQLATLQARRDACEFSQPAPHERGRVFNLMGMDAASVKSLTSVVSQASDGPLARDYAAWEPYERARLADNSDSSDGDEV